MSSSSNIGNANASQVAAANPAADVVGTEGLETVPVAPGVGPEVAMSANGGVMPDLTLLNFEELLNLDPTDGSGTAGRSLETEPLQASPEDGELPADLTSINLDLLLELDLSGADLPTLLEVAGLSGQAQESAGEQSGPPDGVEPSTNSLLDDENDDDGEPGSEDGFDLAASVNGDVTPVDTPSLNTPVENAPGGDGQSSSPNASSGPGIDSGPGNGANVEVASANNAGGNSDNVGGGSENSNAGSNPGSNPGSNGGGNANSNAGANPGNVGGGSANSNAGGNAVGNSGSGAGAAAVAAAGISFPGGGDLPTSITPVDVALADDPGPADSTPASATVPAGPPATVPPANSAVTFVSSNDPSDGPGKSSFGHNNGANVDNNSTVDTPPPPDVPSSTDNNPSPDVTSDTGVSNASAASAASTAGLTLKGSGGADSLVGGDNGDDLSGIGGSDTLEGGAGAETLSGGGGSDLLDGGGGADDLSGGGGADILVWDFDDNNIDGGGGSDTLRVDSGDADIATFGGTITGIENVDLASDAGVNTLTLSAQDVLDMSGTDTLTISGDAFDSLDAGSGWTDGGVSGGNQTYTQVVGPDTATLVVDTDVTVNANILV